ncbi:unnamed protein product [Rotaria magnacalcarata]|nr:unnamed protein product [Rotaria magnacalcarata]
MREKQLLAQQKKTAGNNNEPDGGATANFIDPMIRTFFRRYKLFLYNVTSAAVVLTLGDFCVQTLYDKKKTLDEKRLFAACITGAAMGIEGHVWYGFLDRIIAQATWRNSLKKVICDQTVAAPIYTVTYIMGTSILEGRTSFGQLKSDMKENFVPLYLADCVIFIPVQMINFRYIPAYYRVPFMFMVSFIFNMFLSAYKHTHEEHAKSK